jgi:ATP-dependent Clp protease ATP-binding subunit ClpX
VEEKTRHQFTDCWNSHICDKCIEQAHGIVLEELKSTGSSKLAGDLILKKPKEIRAFLNM